MHSVKRSARQHWQAAAPYLFAFFKSAVLAGAVGLACGLVGTLFHYSVDVATQIRQTHGWLLFLLPLIGVVIAGLYKLAGLGKDPGTNLIIESVRTQKRPPLRQGALIFVSSVLTHLGGGSAGREGAALQIGGSIGSGVGHALHLNEKDSHILILCGMSGLFSALFGTPVTAALFSLEVISVGILHYSALLPCLFSALVAFRIALYFGVEPVAFTIADRAAPGFGLTWRIALLAVMAALVSILFCKVMHLASHLYQRFLPDPMARAAVGGALVVAVTLLLGTRDYNGAGMDVVARALSGQARPEAFLVKMLLTALTLGAGFKGGEIVPAFFVGSTFGCAVAPLLGLDPGFAAAIGLIAVFCGAVNCPVASLLLSVELFGSGSLLCFALACAVSYLMSGPYSLYSTQKLLYSKTEPTFIDAATK